MMPIVVPEGLWEDGEDAVLSSWLYGEGDAVAEGSVVAEVMVGKTSYEMTAPAGGSLRITVSEEAEVAGGTVIGHIA